MFVMNRERIGGARTLLSSLVGLLIGFLIQLPASLRADKPASDDTLFRQVQPIFKARCHRCHGTKTRKADFDLTSLDSIARGGESGSVIDFKMPAESTLLQYVRERTMPPEGEGELTTKEIEAIARWIESVAQRGSIATAREIHQHDVQPILQLRCAVCHGRQRREAGLDVRTKASLLAGGKSGPAIVPGAPEQSLILKRIHAGEMPPRRLLVKVAVKPMAKHEIEMLSQWIAAGAPEKQIKPDVMTSEPDRLISDEDRQFWSFQSPRAATAPIVKNVQQVRSPVDAFILRRLENTNLALSPGADRYTLIRRATIDLLGLPPTPEEVDAFLQDRTPGAYERLIDRLLGSPRYGERWGQHWLDLAGYSDSEGIVNSDPIRTHAWRYRDYVIRAFNNDKPYDRFLLEQLAGDELADYENAEEITQELSDNLVATGFLRLSPDGTFETLTGYVPDRLELIDDEIEILSSAVLGLTINCARCHSHKFDPIPQRDYYRLAAVFKGALDEHDWLKPGNRLLPFVTTREARQWKQAGGKKENQPQIRALWDRGEPSPTYLLKRGNYLTPGRLVGPGVPSVLTDGRTPFEIHAPWSGARKTGRRLALARWLTQEDHPLTARVIVNRIWKHHFGRGLVKTLDNFGNAGARPTHPELLDWLAVRFVQDGWSIKSMHRRIMTSAVYRQSSQVSNVHEKFDPDNELLSRMPLRRMEGEVVRDALLYIAGRLDLTPFGPADRVSVRDDGLVTSTPYQKSSRWRRSIYVLKRRSQPVTILQNFDVGRMDPNCVERSESIVAPQALHLKNNKWVYRLSEALSDRVWRETGDDPVAQIRLVWRLVAGREPDSEELAASRKALSELHDEWQHRDHGVKHELIATRHLWIREIEPDRIFEDDLVSVWSSHSSDKGRRWGLLEFDISSLSDLDLTRAHLQLGVLDTKPIRQSASVIPPGIDKYNWTRYQKDKVGHVVKLQGLGRLASDTANAPIGGYVACSGATPDDLTLLESRARKNGRITLVLKADEDGLAYRRDWDDGVYRTTRNNPPQLVVYDSRRSPDTAMRRALHEFCHALVNSAAFMYID
jgi:mono/diheme cytochrome c family protein